MPSETAIASAPHAFNVLLIYPRFAGGTFWNFAATCEVFGARYPAAPLGLITVAALVTAYRPEQLEGHLRLALENGLSRDELVEAVTHLAFYTGWPKAMLSNTVLCG